MKLMILPALLVACSLAGCDAPPAASSSGGGGIMVPGRAYDAEHSQGYQARMKFTADGKVMVLEDGAYVGQGGWYRRDGKLCTYGEIGGPDYATCTAERAGSGGGFDLIFEDAMIEFRPAAG